MNFLNKLRFRWPSTSQTSSHVAKERLKVALTYDRSGLSRNTIETLRDEIIQLIVKHLAIREEDIQINFDHTTEGDKLVARIPLQTMERPRAQMANAAVPTKVHTRHRRSRRAN